MRRISSFNNEQRKTTTTTTQNNNNINNRIMWTTIQVVVIIAATIIHSATVTNAFVPIKTQTTHTQTQTICGDIFNTRRGAVYSNNNVNGNNNSNIDRLSVPVSPSDDEPIDPTSSSSSTSGQQIEFLFNDDDDDSVANLSDIAPPIEEPVEGSGSSNTNTIVIESLNNDNIKNESLMAVLTASVEAAAEAEASLSPELVEQLDELAIVATNATLAQQQQNTNNNKINIDDSNDEITIIPSPPPEIIATITATTTAVVVDPTQPQPPQVVEELFTPSSIVPGLSDSKSVVVTKDDDNTKMTKEEEEMHLITPSVMKILKFAIPAIGVWLCGPLLSLIDTSAVGILSGTTQQAALNPAVAVTDYAALLIAFLYTGTTNMVASAQESDRGTNDKPKTAKMMIGAMQMSTYVGVGLGSILFIFARPLLTAIIGNDSISPAVFAAAMKYVRIRSLGMPAAAIIGSTQAACLGMQDIKSPLYVLAAAAVVNFLCDACLVGHSNPLLGGAAGAAWATVLSQYAAVTFFMRWLRNKPKPKKLTITNDNEEPPQAEVMNLSNAILEITSKSKVEEGKGRRQSLRNVMDSIKLKGRSSGRSNGLRTTTESKNTASSKKSESFSARGFLNNRFHPKDLFKLPNKETRKEFSPYVLPVTSTQVGRISGYVAMAHVVASSLGTVSMAAQQVIVSIFYCLCPIADSLSLTAQSFVPKLSDKAPSREKAIALRKVLINFLKAGAVFGGTMMAAVSTIPLLSGFFTSDQAVISLVNSVVPLLLVFFGVHGFVCGTEGMLLGQKDLGYLGKMYAAFFAIVPYLMLKVKRKALAGTHAVGLTSVWTVFIGYQLVRCVLWLARSLILQRRTDTEAKLAANDDMLAP
jgi:Na+-driven multidrug efflux pump